MRLIHPTSDLLLGGRRAYHTEREGAVELLPRLRVSLGGEEGAADAELGAARAELAVSQPRLLGELRVRSRIHRHAPGGRLQRSYRDTS